MKKKKLLRYPSAGKKLINLHRIPLLLFRKFANMNKELWVPVFDKEHPRNVLVYAPVKNTKDPFAEICFQCNLHEGFLTSVILQQRKSPTANAKILFSCEVKFGKVGVNDIPGFERLTCRLDISHGADMPEGVSYELIDLAMSMSQLYKAYHEQRAEPIELDPEQYRQFYQFYGLELLPL